MHALVLIISLPEKTKIIDNKLEWNSNSHAGVWASNTFLECLLKTLVFISERMKIFYILKFFTCLVVNGIDFLARRESTALIFHCMAFYGFRFMSWVI